MARRALSTGHVVRSFAPEEEDEEAGLADEAEAYVEGKAEKRTRAKDLLALAVDEFMLPLRAKAKGDKKQPPVDLKTLARRARPCFPWQVLPPRLSPLLRHATMLAGGVARRVSRSPPDRA